MFRSFYIAGSAALVFLYFLEIIIFIVVIINVRKLFKYLDVEYYNLLKVPLGLFIIFVLLFMIYRIGYFIILEFQLLDQFNNYVELLKFTYYVSVSVLIGLLSYINKRSINSDKQEKQQLPYEEDEHLT